MNMQIEIFHRVRKNLGICWKVSKTSLWMQTKILPKRKSCLLTFHPYMRFSWNISRCKAGNNLLEEGFSRWILCFDKDTSCCLSLFRDWITKRQTKPPGKFSREIFETNFQKSFCNKQKKAQKICLSLHFFLHHIIRKLWELYLVRRSEWKLCKAFKFTIHRGDGNEKRLGNAKVSAEHIKMLRSCVTTYCKSFISLTFAFFFRLLTENFFPLLQAPTAAALTPVQKFNICAKRT